MTTLSDRLSSVLAQWADTVGISPQSVPPAPALDRAFSDLSPLRPGASEARIDAWEEAHGFSLPTPLRCWLLLSDGFYAHAPIIHPLTAIGPMIPFARVPNLVVQPESWFELGNPGDETICMDLAYRWPGGDAPIFTSGDDRRGTMPRLIATSFESWFLRVLRDAGREYWFDGDFVSLGDPWREHIRRVPAPELPERLRSVASRARPFLYSDEDDRSIALRLGISRSDLEVVFRHLQHAQGA
jgi:cell wall assembly regulator SMI1